MSSVFTIRVRLPIPVFSISVRLSILACEPRQSLHEFFMNVILLHTFECLSDHIYSETLKLINKIFKHHPSTAANEWFFKYICTQTT
jgi:hypothetical protein